MKNASLSYYIEMRRGGKLLEATVRVRLISLIHLNTLVLSAL